MRPPPPDATPPGSPFSSPPPYSPYSPREEGGIYSGDLLAGGSGILLSVLGILFGGPTIAAGAEKVGNTGVFGVVLVIAFGCAGLYLALNWFVIKGHRWAMIVGLVIVALSLVGALISRTARETGGGGVLAGLSLLRDLALLVYFPLRLGRNLGPEPR